MNNIFNYATKELSQDAFISWIISNYDNELKNISLDFLNFLTNSYLINKIIKNIKIDKQQNKIDVLVQIELCSDEKIILVIEDKIYSNEHDNQLKRYEEKIKNCFSCSKTFYVFYKTSYVFKEDKENIEKKGWGVFDIFRINDFWKKYISSSNLIIKMYSRFIKQKTDDLNTTSLPICYNHTKWEGFFRNYIEERVKKERKQLITWSFITRYRYACFGARGKTKKKDSHI